MSNNLQVEITWSMNKNNVSELHFNYYDKDSNFVGNIDVDAQGNMSWQIAKLEHKEYMMNIINYLYLGEANDRISYDSTTPNGLRWIRARIYIANHGLLINYHQKEENVVEEESSYIR